MIESLEKGRLEDGNRSIAEKIIRRMHELRKTVTINHGRWAWELLQNAKDSIADFEDRTISIRLTLNGDRIEFSHTGMPFTEKDVRGIINQISSKEVQEDESLPRKKTGRFGTGFLTTHLLSAIVRIKGILKSDDGQHYRFKFLLDRDAKNTQELIPKIEKAWVDFHESATLMTLDFDQDDFNTAFVYMLPESEQKDFARIGLEEFQNLIPFVLAFNPTLANIEIIDNTQNQAIFYSPSRNNKDSSLVKIKRSENGNANYIRLLVSSSERVTIAAQVEKTGEAYSFLNMAKIPKIFCSYPLVGTEQFHFPVIMNSVNFTPQTERNGIWLKGKDDNEVTENQSIIQEAVSLYEELLNDISEGDFLDCFNIAESRLPNTDEIYFDSAWFREKIQKPIRKAILNNKLVETNVNHPPKDSIKELWFPPNSLSKTTREKIWELTSALYPQMVCRKEHLHKWCDLFWEGWNAQTLDVLVNDVVSLKNFDGLKKQLDLSEKRAFEWLNAFGEYLFENEANHALIEKSPIIPNRKGDFRKRPELYIDYIKDEKLVDILRHLGNDWNHILIHPKVGFGKYQTKKKEDICQAIASSMRRANTQDEGFKEAVRLTMEWFDSNSDEGARLLPEIFVKRAELFMSTIEDKDALFKVMRSNTGLADLSKVVQAIDDNPELIKNLGKSDELVKLMDEFEANDISELRKMLLHSRHERAESSLSDLTPDILASLGVTSASELEEALSDRELGAQFRHSSTPNIEAFMFAQRLISNAKERIKVHLQSLPGYDCKDMEEVATTVIGGIKKEGLAIHVVVRPAYNGYVIVYYNSEKDTLDYANGELWIDDGIEPPRQLTLGKLLKDIGINKIPV